MTIKTILQKKLEDSVMPGFIVVCEPAEALLAGAFVEDALDFDEAYASSSDDFDMHSGENYV